MVRLTKSRRYVSLHTGRLVSAYMASVLSRPLPTVTHPGVQAASGWLTPTAALPHATSVEFAATVWGI